MIMKYKIIVFITCMFTLCGHTAVLAKDGLWVVSKGAELKADCTATSETISALPIGTELFVRAYEKRWYLVFSAAGDNGWVYRGKVSTEPPEENMPEEGKDFFQVEYSVSKIDGDEIYSARSIRGVSPSDGSDNGVSEVADEYAKIARVKKRCSSALESVISIQTADDEIKAFLKEGKIGEYAE